MEERARGLSIFSKLSPAVDISSDIASSCKEVSGVSLLKQKDAKTARKENLIKRI